MFSNEICGAPGATGGVTMIDVTDPTAPTVLAAGFGDTDGTAPRAHTVHSVFAWQDGPKAYATLVDNEDAADVDIFDVTDPRNPVMVAEYDLAERFPQILQPEVPNLNQVFLHDLVVKKIKGRQVMLASYWDAGYVKLDVTDPRNVTYLGDTDFTNPDPELLAQTGTRELPEGNAHYADFTKDNRYIVAADEDFSPYGLAGSTDDGTTFAAQVGSATKPITPDAPLAGTAVYVGRACTSDPAVPTPPATGGPYLAVAERGGCAFTEKVANVEAVTANGGYAGTVVFNIATPAGCGSFGMSVQGNKPAVSVDRGTGYSLFDLAYDEAACRAGAGELAPLTGSGRGFRHCPFVFRWVGLCAPVPQQQRQDGRARHLRDPRGDGRALRHRLRRLVRARGGAQRQGRFAGVRLLLCGRIPRHEDRGRQAEGGRAVHRPGWKRLLGGAGLHTRRPGVRRCQRPGLRALHLLLHRRGEPAGRRR